MTQTDSFEIITTKSLSENGVSFHEILFRDRYAPIEITFRAYPRNVFVATEDNSNNQSSGADLDDCYVVSPVILEKTARELFNPKQAFLKACKHVYGDYEFEDLWSQVVEDVVRWMTMWTECPHLRVHLHSKLWAAQTLYCPAEYEYKAECQDCGKWMDVEDVPEEAEREG